MPTDTQFHEIRGLFAAAHESPEELEGAPPISYYKFYELEMAIPIVVGFIRDENADPADLFDEEGHVPVVAQRLARNEQDGEWEWRITTPETMLKTLEFGDAVDLAKFRDSVRLFLERREQADADNGFSAPANDDTVIP